MVSDWASPGPWCPARAGDRLMTNNDPASTDTKSQPASSRADRHGRWRPVIWVAVAILAVAAAYSLFRIVTTPPTSPASPLAATPSPTPLPVVTAAAFPTPDPAFVSATSTPEPPATPAPAAPPPTPTLAPDETMIKATPAAGLAGWVSSGESRGNHFGDSFLHAGTVQDQLFHSANSIRPFTPAARRTYPLCRAAAYGAR